MYIEPDKNCAPNKVVRFHLNDGAICEFKTEYDHNTFLTWWSETARVINRIKALQNLDEQL